MKKFFAILLASVMLISVFVLPVSAETTYSTSDDRPYAGDLYHYSDTYSIRGEGIFTIRPEYRTFYYGITCRNMNIGTEVYTLNAQCVALYSDDTHAFYSFYEHWFVNRDQIIGTGRTIPFPDDKTIIGLDGEFRIHHETELLWEGYLYPTIILGINA